MEVHGKAIQQSDHAACMTQVQSAGTVLFTNDVSTTPAYQQMSDICAYTSSY